MTGNKYDIYMRNQWKVRNKSYKKTSIRNHVIYNKYINKYIYFYFTFHSIHEILKRYFCSHYYEYTDNTKILII